MFWRRMAILALIFETVVLYGQVRAGHMHEAGWTLLWMSSALFCYTMWTDDEVKKEEKQ